MTICREIIKSAYRRAGVLAHGKDVGQTQLDVGLEILIDMFKNGVVGGLLGRLTRYIHDDATPYTIPSDFVHVHDVQGSGIVLPTQVLTDSGTYRLPYSGAVIIHTDVANEEIHNYIYNNLVGAWQELELLTATAQCPFTPGYNKAVKDWLAQELADEIGMPPETIRVRKAAAGRLSLATQYGSDERTEKGTYF